MCNKQINILYDTLGKVELVEMVMKELGMETKDIVKVKQALSDKIKGATS